MQKLEKEVAERRKEIKEANLKASDLEMSIFKNEKALARQERCLKRLPLLETRLEEECLQPLGCLLQSFA